ncbi:hypothetical protein [Halomarina oriensis]|nr:hypothetical protein [Halomarina oriensis]
MAPEVPLTRRSLLASGVCLGAGLVGVEQFRPAKRRATRRFDS